MRERRLFARGVFVASVAFVCKYGAGLHEVRWFALGVFVASGGLVCMRGVCLQAGDLFA